MIVGEAFVVEAHKVENGRIEVVPTVMDELPKGRGAGAAGLIDGGY